MKSLFVVALPRSTSTRVYDIARRTLNLAAPEFTTDGEILNVDRHILATREQDHRGRKFLTRARDPAAFSGALAYLNAVTRSENYAYKDVVNPFVVSQWAGMRELSVLRIRRDVADVGLAMMSRGWDYPAVAADPVELRRRVRRPWDWIAVEPWIRDRRWLRRHMAGYPLDAVLEALIAAEAALASLPGETIDFDEFVNSEMALARALERLYPGVALPPLRYLNDDFRRARDEQLAKRRTPAYAEIARRTAMLREAVHAPRDAATGRKTPPE